MIKQVESYQLYNLGLFEPHLILDVRPQQDYMKGHVATAVNTPPPRQTATDSDRQSSLVAFLASVVNDCGMDFGHVSPVVLYGDGSAASTTHVRWMAERLASLKTQMVCFGQVPAGHSGGVAELADRIAKYTEECWLLQDTYDEFSAIFPYLCGLPPGEEVPPLPTQIVPGIFLGCRPLGKRGSLCLSPAWADSIGLSAFLLSSGVDPPPEAAAVLRTTEPDDPNLDMQECWRQSSAFIERALAQ
eukprot:gene294-2395_t